MEDIIHQQLVVAQPVTKYPSFNVTTKSEDSLQCSQKSDFRGTVLHLVTWCLLPAALN